MDKIAEMRETKSRLLQRWKKKHLVELIVKSVNNQETMVMYGPEGIDYCPGRLVMSTYNNKVFVSEIVEVHETLEKLNKQIPEKHLMVIGVVDTGFYESFRQQLSNIACQLDKRIQEEEEQTFANNAKELFKMTPDEMKKFGL